MAKTQTGVRKLSEDEKFHLLHRLACFASPAEMVKEMHELYGIEMSIPAVLVYDATSSQSRNLSAEHRRYFLEIRQRFIETETDVAIANRTWRLERLMKLLEHTLVKQSPKLALLVLEQAAKERGGLYLRQEKLDPKDLSDEQIIRILEGKAQSGGQTSETADSGMGEGEQPGPP